MLFHVNCVCLQRDHSQHSAMQHRYKKQHSLLNSCCFNSLFLNNSIIHIQFYSLKKCPLTVTYVCCLSICALCFFRNQTLLAFYFVYNLRRFFSVSVVGTKISSMKFLSSLFLGVICMNRCTCVGWLGVCGGEQERERKNN